MYLVNTLQKRNLTGVMSMKLRNVLKWLPIHLVFLILIMAIISSFDGVVLSATISNVTHFTSKSTNIDVLRYVALSFTAMFAVYAAMIFTQRLKNRAIKLMNIKMKENFIYQKLVHSKFNDDATGKISQIFNDFKLIEQQYFGLIFELITSLLTGVVSAIYILTLNIPVGLLFILFSTLPMVSSKLFSKQLTEAAAVWQSDSSRFLSKVTDLFNE